MRGVDSTKRRYHDTVVAARELCADDAPLIERLVASYPFKPYRDYRVWSRVRQRAILAGGGVILLFVLGILIAGIRVITFPGYEDGYRKYVDRYPDDPNGHFELARLLANENKVDEATKQAELALQLDPGSIWRKLFLAELYQYSNNLDGAISIYEKVEKK